MYPIDFLASITGCFHQITLSYGLPMSLFIAGLVGGVTHCVVMCGPFVISQSGAMKKLSETALIPYHLGRMTTYIFLAILAYSIFSLVFVYSDLKSMMAAPLLFLAAIIFIVSAFPKLKYVFPWLSQVKFPILFSSNFASKLSAKNNILHRYFLGVLLGFMPCAMVVAAIMASASAPTLLIAVISMAAFAMGTVPALFLLAIGSKSINSKYPKFSIRFSQTAKVLSAIWLCILAGTLIL